MRWTLLLASLLLLAGCDPSRGVPIFLWHAVGEGSPADPYDVSPAEFDQELTELEAFGATPITLDQLFDARDGEGELPPRPVVLTFDDGRACQLTAALPILKKHGMVAETFVVAGFLADDAAHRHVERDATGVHPYLTWPELKEMVASGAFHAESHGMGHTYLPRLSQPAQRAELADSRRLLAARLGTPIDFFSYPFGSFTWHTRNDAEAAGYRGAVSVQKGLGSRYGMLRTSLHRGDAPALRKALERAFGEPRR